MTRDAAELCALERALAERLIIVDEIIRADGTIVATYRRTVPLPKKENR